MNCIAGILCNRKVDFVCSAQNTTHFFFRFAFEVCHLIFEFCSEITDNSSLCTVVKGPVLNKVRPHISIKMPTSFFILFKITHISDWQKFFKQKN
jgi:hypothetical protein